MLVTPKTNQTLIIICGFCPADLEFGDVPQLTPGSKQMMADAVMATFSGFTKEQQRLGIPKGAPVSSVVLSSC